MENDSEFEHVKMKGHRNSVLALGPTRLSDFRFFPPSLLFGLHTYIFGTLDYR